MSDALSERPTEAKSSQKSTIIFTVLATLAFVFVFERLPAYFPRPDSQARAKRSEALFASQEQQSKEYQEYLERGREDEKRSQALLARQEQITARFEKILDTWEQQQKTYQAYLDSLN